MNEIIEKESHGIKMSPLFEVSFTSPDGKMKITISELLPASGFEDARVKAVRIAEAQGLMVMGIIRSPWRVITEFVEFV
jgi:hypothetical protein